MRSPIPIKSVRSHLFCLTNSVSSINGILTGDNMARELAGRGIGHETHAENKAVYEV
ncbi:MAG TPA: hypothetical protein IGS53_22835 [Leptolyngbyaceae cyanobacterium M33_DOE_097]|nr:hypothetical protein [Leptolyngbyaceae cyanobacterium M33_DOE_097]